jgi:TolB-like protein/tetratricopeptide (TPR) repeat protein
MPSDSESDLQLEIGHVLLIDIVGYSKLLITEQRERLHALNEIVRNTAQFRASDADGMLVRIPTGDGMALIFRDTVEAPLRCAVEISQAIKAHPEIQLRMGIHSGAVSEVRDVNERTNVAGAGIDIAQRVMDCGDAGHILLSKHVAEDLAPHPRWNRCLHDLGECEVKHGVRLGVVNFYGDEIGNPKVPKQLQVLQKHRARTRWTAIFAALLLFIGVFVAFVILSKQSAKSISTVPPKSIAVLPFDNLSRDPDNAYFAEGVQDEILTRLAKIADLKVISRTSTQHFKSSPDNLPQIAKQLGVSNILEGSVQKSGDSVRVNVQLIKALTDAHLWAETYDRKLTDIFAVETDIAKTIANTLRARLTGAEHSAIAAQPTEDSEAHELYLKGRYFFGKRTVDDFKRAIDYFNQALARDPNYGRAYAGIADSYVLLQQYSNESSAELFPKARAAAEKALAIDNDLAEPHVSLGLLHSADFNLNAAKREFERAVELNPNYATARYFLGFRVLASLGQLDQALAQVKRAVELDPFSAIMNTNFGLCYILARRYPEAIAQLRKATELNPNFTQTHVFLGLALELSGDSAGAIREYEKAYEVGKAHGTDVKYVGGGPWLAYAYALQGEREQALQLLGPLEDLERRTGGVGAFGLAEVHLRLGQKEQAIDWLERSYRDKELPISFIKVLPDLDPLRGDPRFEKLANQIIPPGDAR